MLPQQASLFKWAVQRWDVLPIAGNYLTLETIGLSRWLLRQVVAKMARRICLSMSVLIHLYRVRLLSFTCIHSFIVAQRHQHVCKLVKFCNFSQTLQAVLERNTCRSNWSRNKWVWTVFHMFDHYYHRLFQRLPWHLLALSLSGACDIEVLTLASCSGCAGLRICIACTRH